MKLNIGFFLGSKFGKGNNFSNLTKKVFLINDFDYWDPLKNLLGHMIKQEFLEEKIMLKNIEFINFCEIEERLKNVKNSS